MYALQQALRAIRSNWVASMATVTTMTLSLTILAGFSLLTLNLNQVLQELQDELELAVYLSSEANADDLHGTIQGWSEVASAGIISPDDALRSLVADLPYLQQAAGVVDNPLPTTIELRLHDPTQTPEVSRRLRTLPGVVDVEDGSEAVETFLAISDALRIMGSIIIVVLLAASLFAIINSIRAAIAARQEEIEVMRLVGATRGFIRAPFLIEGFILGCMSALVTLLLVVPGYQFVIDRLGEYLLFIPFVRDRTMLIQLAGMLAALSLLVGLIGSAISVSRYLREGY